MAGMSFDWGSLVIGPPGEGFSLQLLQLGSLGSRKDVKLGCWRSGEGMLGFSHQGETVGPCVFVK